jgi:hypothetical protein
VIPVRLLTAAALAIFLASCAGGGGGSLRLDPDPMLFTAVRQTAPASASAAGVPVAPGALTWSTGDASIATVDAAGVVRAVASGSTSVRATWPGAAATATVIVDAAVVYEPCVIVSQVGETACGTVTLTVTLP